MNSALAGIISGLAGGSQIISNQFADKINDRRTENLLRLKQQLNEENYDYQNKLITEREQVSRDDAVANQEYLLNLKAELNSDDAKMKHGFRLDELREKFNFDKQIALLNSKSKNFSNTDASKRQAAEDTAKAWKFEIEHLRKQYEDIVKNAAISNQVPEVSEDDYIYSKIHMKNWRQLINPTEILRLAKLQKENPDAYEVETKRPYDFKIDDIGVLNKDALKMIKILRSDKYGRPLSYDELPEKNRDQIKLIISSSIKDKDPKKSLLTMDELKEYGWFSGPDAEEIKKEIEFGLKKKDKPKNINTIGVGLNKPVSPAHGNYDPNLPVINHSGINFDAIHRYLYEIPESK